MTTELHKVLATMLLLLVSLFAQGKGRVIVTPDCYYSGEVAIVAPRRGSAQAKETAPLTITQVELGDSATVVRFSVSAERDSKFVIHSGAMLRDERGRFYPAIAAQGITLGNSAWVPESGNAEFAITFRPLPVDTRMFDFVSSLIHRNKAVVLGVTENGAVSKSEKAKRYCRVSLPNLVSCNSSFGTKASIRGRIVGYNSDSAPQSIYLCEQAIVNNEHAHVIGAGHITPNGSFVIEAEIDKAGMYMLASEEGASEWNIPLVVHPGDAISIGIDLNACTLTSFKSKCTTQHMQKMQMVAAFPSHFIQPEEGMSPNFLLINTGTSNDLGRKLVEKIARKYRGRYVEFIGMNARNMTATMNTISNIRYDYYRNPDLKIVYLFNGRTVSEDYYSSFVERYLQGEDCHLMSSDEYSAVREYMLSRQPTLVGTLNRNGIPFMFPLDYADEFEFRRRFRMMVKAETLSESEVENLDTMIEVPDTFSIIYDRERRAVFADDEETITPLQAKKDRRTLNILWSIISVLGILVSANVIVLIFRRKRHKEKNVKPAEDLAKIDERDAVVSDVSVSVAENNPTADTYFDNLLMALTVKKHKNKTFLAKLQQQCPDLTKREQAMCILYYSESLPDDKMMELLEIPSPSAFRTAKSRLRKKLTNYDFNTLRI